MRSCLFTVLLAVAGFAFVFAAYNGPTDLEIQKLTGTSVNPPYDAPDPSRKEDVGWAYPDPKKIIRPSGAQGKCSIFISVDVVS